MNQTIQSRYLLSNDMSHSSSEWNRFLFFCFLHFVSLKQPTKMPSKVIPFNLALLFQTIAKSRMYSNWMLLFSVLVVFGSFVREKTVPSGDIVTVWSHKSPQYNVKKGDRHSQHTELVSKSVYVKTFMHSYVSCVIGSISI